MLDPALTQPAAAIAGRLKARGQSIAVVESAAGGLISASLLAVPGASAYFLGGVVIYTLEGARAQLVGAPPMPPDVRGASEPFARWLASSAATVLSSDWGVGETGAAGPAGNRYGSPAGHSWVAVRRPDGEVLAREVLTDSDDRAQNMETFAAAALGLLLESLS